MELTHSEKRILRAAETSFQNPRNNQYKFRITGLVVGVIGGIVLIIYGFIGWISNQPDALRAISYGLLLIGSIGSMYENSRLKSEAILLIKHLQNQIRSAEDINVSAEQRINHPISSLWLVIGLVGAAMIVIYEFIEVVSSKDDSIGIRSSFWLIIFSLLLIGFLGVMYENLRFKNTVLKLIRKLVDQRKEIQ
jgi:hypothetical protein